jgi:4-hydroxy-L-threonine phosphate dehydrogenase PdxA
MPTGGHRQHAAACRGRPRLRAVLRGLQSQRAAPLPRVACEHAHQAAVREPAASAGGGDGGGRRLHLPVVDVSGSDDVAAAQLLAASSEYGFQCVVGHGLEDDAAVAAAAVTGTVFVPWRATAGDGWRGTADMLRKRTPGHGPGLQYAGHTDSEAYSTTEGEYGVFGREDFVVIHPVRRPPRASQGA